MIEKRKSLPPGVSLHSNGMHFARRTIKGRNGSSKRITSGYHVSPYEALDDLNKRVREAQMIVDGRRSVEHLLNEFLDAITNGSGSTKRVAPATVSIRTSALQALLPKTAVKGRLAGHKAFAVLRDRQAKDFDANDLRTFLTQLQANNVGTRSAQQSFEALRAAFRWAEKREYVDPSRSPFRLVDRPEHTATKRRRLNDDDVKRLFESIRSTKSVRARALFLLMLHTGVRPGEALGLRWEFVDFDR